MKRFIFPLLAAVCLQSAEARINVTSLPGRDSVQLTIYNSADLTLVKETRTLTLKKGRNRLEFSWAGTLIDPTSVEFRPITHADEVEILDVRFPPRVTNTLEWNIHSEFAGEVKTEIRYFTSGITWNADYLCEANANENQMTFAGNVRVTNRSGEDYPKAQIRLVVGVVRLVEKIIDLARQGQPAPPSGGPRPSISTATRARAAGAMGQALAEAEQRKDVAKEALGEYFLYTVGGRDTIANGWSKRLPSFNTA
ncbi:MAG: hypothetical protein H8E27_02180, partial [Verrucomicrobia subdivision 3 bacterium]|nr:hypothetical protein [Limisphaerales bacterium]